MSSSDYERELVSRWQAGDRAAGDEIVAAHFDQVRRYFAQRAPDLVRLDLVQETFTRLSASIVNFRAASRLRTYVLGIARIVLAEYCRQLAARPVDAIDTMPGDPSNIHPSSFVRRRSQYVRLLWALNQLSDGDKEILDLYYWQGLSAREIAEILKRPASSIRRRLSETRVRLRAWVQDSSTERITSEHLDQNLFELGRLLAGELFQN